MLHCIWHWLPPFVILSAAKNLFSRCWCWFSCHLLFLPAAGDRKNGQVRYEQSRPRYWSGTGQHDTGSFAFLAFSSSFDVGGDARCTAFAIRLASVVSEELIGLAKDCPFMMSKD